MSITLNAPVTTTVEATRAAGMTVETAKTLLNAGALLVLSVVLFVVAAITGSPIALVAASLPLVGGCFLGVFAAYRQVL